ncbi:MAG: nucleoside deaminase [Rhodopirellula sp. JB044]|uniref:nucleoside deaminase n=1 Tax=Rhodopirellula sp. JB044 TaxID=3342844 RepID=UPI00370A1359
MKATAQREASPQDIDLSTLERWMLVVLDELRSGLKEGQSPFAAGVFSPSGDMVALAHNTVSETSEVSRHGEVNAINAACKKLNTPDLSGYVLVSSGEPCPMCAATALLAKVGVIAYGASCETITDAGYATLGLSCEKFVSSSDKAVQLISGVCEPECCQLLLSSPAG